MRFNFTKLYRRALVALFLALGAVVVLAQSSGPYSAQIQSLLRSNATVTGTWTFSTPPIGAGTGTVTHTAGALTANAVVIGNGAADETVLGSLGTTTTVLHGNASGAPTFGAVALATDVSGNLSPNNLNGGTGASSTTFWRGDGTWASAGSSTPLGMATFTAPSTAGWTFINQGSSTLTANTGYMTLLAAGVSSGHNMVAITKSAPATPYHIVAAILPGSCCKSANTYGLCFSDGTQFHQLSLRQFGSGDNRYVADYYTGATTFSANRTSVVQIETQLYWFRIGDDGTTNKTMDVSPDGINWLNVWTVSRTTDFTASQIGFCADTWNFGGPTWNIPMSIVSYQVTS